VGIKLNQNGWLALSSIPVSIDDDGLFGREIVFSNHPGWLKSRISGCDPNKHSEYDTAAGKTICHAHLTIAPNRSVVFPAGDYLIFEYPLSLRDNRGPWRFYQIRDEQAAMTMSLSFDESGRACHFYRDSAGPALPRGAKPISSEHHGPGAETAAGAE